MVARRSAELQWTLPDMESVCSNSTICHVIITACVEVYAVLLRNESLMLFSSSCCVHCKHGMCGVLGVLQGPSNPLSLRRTFGTTGEPKLKLYRDHAAWCPYCQKVRPALCPQQHIAGKEATACC